VQRQLRRTGRIGENGDAASRDRIRRELGAVPGPTGQRGEYVTWSDELTAGRDAGHGDVRTHKRGAEYPT
jgi:hypothetical protein